MRVVINQVTAFGRRTGIGHYASELLRCLQAQAAGDQIDGFAPQWVDRAWRAWQGLGSHLKERRRSNGRSSGLIAANLTKLKSQAAQHLRGLSQAVVAHHFRSVCAREGPDLYHEPNYIPLHSDVPTVAT